MHPIPGDNPFQIVQTPTKKDPVCGMDVDPQRAASTHTHNGTTYYFCSQHCVQKFKADPEKFLSDATQSEEMPQDAEYTCPMHPEVEIGRAHV